jgi:O-antigen ligase
MRADFWNMVRGRGLSNMHHLNYAGVTALATLMGLGLTWAFYYTGKKSAAFLTLLLTLCAAMGLWLTKSKGAIAPFLMVLPVFIYVQLYHWVQRWILIAAVAAAAVLLLPKVPQALVQEFKFPAPEIHLGSQAERRDLWQAGAAMVEERPVTGWGERGYNLAYPRFQVPGAVGVAKYDMPALEASHMHSDFLNTAVLYGIVGLLIQLFYYFFGAVLYWRERFKIRLMSDRPFAAAAAGCIPLMALMGVTQCHFTSEIVQMSFWLGVGALFSILESDRLTHGS